VEFSRQKTRSCELLLGRLEITACRVDTKVEKCASTCYRIFHERCSLVRWNRKQSLGISIIQMEYEVRYAVQFRHRRRRAWCLGAFCAFSLLCCVVTLKPLVFHTSYRTSRPRSLVVVFVPRVSLARPRPRHSQRVQTKVPTAETKNLRTAGCSSRLSYYHRHINYNSSREKKKTLVYEVLRSP
jgi:hypothetical protein